MSLRKIILAGTIAAGIVGLNYHKAEIDYITNLNSGLYVSSGFFNFRDCFGFKTELYGGIKGVPLEDLYEQYAVKDPEKKIDFDDWSKIVLGLNSVLNEGKDDILLPYKTGDYDDCDSR